MNRPSVFVVMGRTGEYSDRRKWPVTWFDTVPAARDRAMTLTAWANDLQESDPGVSSWTWNTPYDVKAKWPDPNAQFDYTGTEYFVMEVKGV